jgi:hypothetical protein
MFLSENTLIGSQTFVTTELQRVANRVPALAFVGVVFKPMLRAAGRWCIAPSHVF